MVIGKAVFISQRNPFFRMLKSTRNRQNQKKVTISYAFPGISCFFFKRYLFNELYFLGGFPTKFLRFEKI